MINNNNNNNNSSITISMIITARGNTIPGGKGVFTGGACCPTARARACACA